MLTTVHADSDRLSRLITELLDVARLDTGRLSMHQRPCDVAQLTHRVIDSVRAGAPHRIEYVAPDDLPGIWADPDKFTQVLTNVLENAIRHGSDPVTVTASRDGDLVAVQVDDSGDGIAPEVRQRAFTKFWTTGQRGGSGLGLYLVNGLVRAHGGTVTIGDAPGGRRPDRDDLARVRHRPRLTRPHGETPSQPPDAAFLDWCGAAAPHEHRERHPCRARTPSTTRSRSPRSRRSRSRPCATRRWPRSPPPTTSTRSSRPGSTTPATGRRWRWPTARSARSRRRPRRRPASASGRPAGR